MEMLDSLYLTDVLNIVVGYLLVPTVVVLMLLIIYSLYSLGSLLVEAVAERRYYRARIPELVARLEEAPVEGLSEVVDASGLLRRQKDDLDELLAYLYLPEDGRTEVAKRLLANEDLRNQRSLGRTEAVAKVAPMLGLMGTLIPLGPGIIALGTGDVETLSGALLVAFDTTVAGLAAAVICYVVTRVRRGWYDDYMVSMEAAYNAILERATVAHEEGHEFPHAAYVYAKGGRKARLRDLDAGAAAAGADGAAGADDGAAGAADGAAEAAAEEVR